MCPEQIGGSAVRAEVERTEAGNGHRPVCSCRWDRSRQRSGPQVTSGAVELTMCSTLAHRQELLGGAGLALLDGGQDTGHLAHVAQHTSGMERPQEPRSGCESMARKANRGQISFSLGAKLI